ncbi:MAG: hypothetical protein ACFBSG_05585 [Leptolyngbyaceae cyanobacterium]
MHRKVSVKITIVLISAACLGVIAQADVPLMMKPALLLLPLQVSAIAYVIWHWQRRTAQHRQRSRAGTLPQFRSSPPKEL